MGTPLRRTHRAASEVHVHPDDGGGRDRGLQVSGDGPDAGAQVERQSVVGQERRGPASQLLGLASRHVHARGDVQRLVAEAEGAEDPRRGLTRLAAAQPGLERGGVGGGGQEGVRLLHGGDAAGGRQAIDDAGPCRKVPGREGGGHGWTPARRPRSSTKIRMVRPVMRSWYLS